MAASVRSLPVRLCSVILLQLQKTCGSIQAKAAYRRRISLSRRSFGPRKILKGEFQELICDRSAYFGTITA